MWFDKDNSEVVRTDVGVILEWILNWALIIAAVVIGFKAFMFLLGMAIFGLLLVVGK